MTSKLCARHSCCGRNGQVFAEQRRSSRFNFSTAGQVGSIASRVDKILQEPKGPSTVAVPGNAWEQNGDFESHGFCRHSSMRAMREPTAGAAALSTCQTSASFSYIPSLPMNRSLNARPCNDVVCALGRAQPLCVFGTANSLYLPCSSCSEHIEHPWSATRSLTLALGVQDQCDNQSILLSLANDCEWLEGGSTG
jgi:hypothetical protein